MAHIFLNEDAYFKVLKAFASGKYDLVGLYARYPTLHRQLQHRDLRSLDAFKHGLSTLL
jgi:hypothetical protein